MNYFYDLLINWAVGMSILTIPTTLYKTYLLPQDASEQDNSYFIYLKKNHILYILGTAMMLLSGRYFTQRFEDNFWQDSFNLKIGMLIIAFAFTFCGFVATVVFGLSNIICTKNSFERKKLKYIDQEIE
jgi:hypothetical protein